MYDWIGPMRPKVCDDGIDKVIEDGRYASELLFAVATQIEQVTKAAITAMSDEDAACLTADIQHKLSRIKELISQQISDLTKLAEAELGRRVNQNTQFHGD
jgi:hypothetical protein